MLHIGFYLFLSLENLANCCEQHFSGNTDHFFCEYCKSNSKKMYKKNIICEHIVNQLDRKKGIFSNLYIFNFLIKKSN